MTRVPAGPTKFPASIPGRSKFPRTSRELRRTSHELRRTSREVLRNDRIDYFFLGRRELVILSFLSSRNVVRQSTRNRPAVGPQSARNRPAIGPQSARTRPVLGPALAPHLACTLRQRKARFPQRLAVLLRRPSVGLRYMGERGYWLNEQNQSKTVQKAASSSLREKNSCMYVAKNRSTSLQSSLFEPERKNSCMYVAKNRSTSLQSSLFDPERKKSCMFEAEKSLNFTLKQSLRSREKKELHV